MKRTCINFFLVTVVAIFICGMFTACSGGKEITNIRDYVPTIASGVIETEQSSDAMTIIVYKPGTITLDKAEKFISDCGNKELGFTFVQKLSASSRDLYKAYVGETEVNKKRVVVSFYYNGTDGSAQLFISVG